MKKSVKIIIAVLVAVAVIGGILFAVTNKKKAPETISEETQSTVIENELSNEGSVDKTEKNTQAEVVEGTSLVENSEPETDIETTKAVSKSGFDPEKKGTLIKSKCNSKIWANTLGECYLVLRNIDEKNEWEEKGKVYEIHVTYVKTGEEYGMWADGYWEMNEDCTELTLTPVNQSENGSIGVAVGQSKTYKAKNGVFEIPVAFERGGKTVIYMNLSKDALK